MPVGRRCSDSLVENSLVSALSDSKGGIGMPVGPRQRSFLGVVVDGGFSPHRFGLVVAEEGEHGGDPSVEGGVSGVEAKLHHDVVDVLFHG